MTPAVAVELFAASNLGFLVLDVWLAHSANAFHHWSEWIPVAFAAAAALALAVNLLVSRPFWKGPGRVVGYVVGAGCILVGIGGLVLHLESAFFQTFTLRGLVYSAPFVAPLAFTGLGFLVLLGRMVPRGSVEWGQWVALLALGGFVGNFGLSLADHAQNGFFHALEWLSVAASALAVGFFLVLVLRPDDATLRVPTLVVLALQAATGLLGFVLHLRHLLDPTLATLAERVIYGPPIFAPLLFVDLAGLGALAVWGLAKREA